MTEPQDNSRVVKTMPDLLAHALAIPERISQ